MSTDNNEKSLRVINGGKDDQLKSTQTDFSKAVSGENDDEYASIVAEIDSFFNFEAERFDY